MKIALFGGRFDAPHKGHLEIARHTLRVLPVIDTVWMMPVPQHHWKPSIASPQDRFAMVGCIEGEGIVASDFEIRHQSMFTIDTVRLLQATSQHTYVWICGSDQIYSFDKWKDYQELQQRIEFIVFPRKGYQLSGSLPENFSWLPDSQYLPTHYSSTEVRDKIKQGLSISHLVTPEVEAYIKEKKLYQ